MVFRTERDGRSGWSILEYRAYLGSMNKKTLYFVKGSNVVFPVKSGKRQQEWFAREKAEQPSAEWVLRRRIKMPSLFCPSCLVGATPINRMLTNSGGLGISEELNGLVTSLGHFLQHSPH